MTALERTVREASGRVIAALAARFRDLDLAEESFAEACARAVAAWNDGPPRDPTAWLFRVGERVALDVVRKRGVRAAAQLPDPEPEPDAEQRLMADDRIITDERLRLIFTCCHPALAPDARAALTLKLVCGLSTGEIAAAFLTAEPALAQRIVRAKRKIADAGIVYEVPGPEAWPERLEAVLTTLEIAYARAHADAAGTGRHAGYAAEMLAITAVLASLLPNEPEVHALGAIVRFAEARRPARVDGTGMMVPLDRQDPRDWDRALIVEGRQYLARALAAGSQRERTLRALIHAEWGARVSTAVPPPWPAIRILYDALLALRDDPIVRLNRAVAIAETEGAEAALLEVDTLADPALPRFLPYQVVRADLLARVGQRDSADSAYAAALSLEPDDAERRWLTHQKAQNLSFP